MSQSHMRATSPQRRTAAEAWLRASALLCCVYRAHLEVETAAAARDQLTELQQWIDQIGLANHMTLVEREICATGHGSLSDVMHTRAGWKEEGAAAIAWALRQVERLPVYWQQALLSEADMFQGMRLLNLKTEDARFSFRPDLNAETCAEFYGVLVVQLRKATNRVRVANFSKSALAIVTCDGAALQFAGNDLAIDGRALSELSSREISDALSIASERYRAFAWLAGVLNDYDARPLEVSV